MDLFYNSNILIESKKRSILNTSLLVLLLGLFQNLGISQTSVYHPFLNESYWNVNVTFFNLNNYYSYTTIGDTTINNIGYKKIIKQNGNPILDTIYCLREEIPNKVVLMWNGNADIPLYNFNLNLGDMIYMFINSSVCTGVYGFQVSYIDSVLLGFGYTKRFYLTSNNQAYPSSLYLIEGVGSIEEPISIISCSIDPSYSLVCNSQNGVQIYGNNCSQMPPPNSVQNSASTINTFNPYLLSVNQNQFTLQSNLNDQTPISIEFFDLTGRSISKINDVKPGSSFPNSLQNTGVYLIKLTHPSGLHFSQKIYWSN
ncbi:MAG: T9SS type A sorting domain-containing protein [Bacteroidia bacterium]|jgi:hypothetical protein|nr:T9SS type A sorting domain-containing protein [Bacteroidia bacterium]